MPDETPGFPDTKKNNDEVAEKLKQQDINGLSTATSSDLKDSDSALDELVEAKKKEKEVVEQTPDPEPPKEEAQTPPAKTEAELEAEKKAQAEAATKAEADKKRADEIFKDTPSLPPNASPKSTEAFATIKLRATQEISKLEQERDQLRKENEDLKVASKSQKALTPEVEKEIEELRHFRTRIDLEADPKFKVFDQKIESAREFIYGQLQKSPAVGEEVIAEIKKLGGPDKVKMDKIFEAIKDPMIQRFVESKLADIEQASFEKQNAIKAAKENVAQYLQEREKSIGEAAKAHNTETQKIFDGLLSSAEGLKWLTDRKVDEKADEATRKAAAEHNAFVKATREQLSSAVNDDSPEMRAILLAGFAQLLYTQRTHAADKARLSSIDAEHKKVVEAKDATIKELQTKLDKIKNASVSRLESSGAVSGKAPEIRSGDIDIRPTTQALDDIARDLREKRNL